jgi:hypothetical protein
MQEEVNSVKKYTKPQATPVTFGVVLANRA